MRRGGKLVVGARHRVQDRARGVAAEVGSSGRCTGLTAVTSAWFCTNWSKAAPLVAWCLRIKAMADWISATALMLRSSFSARRRFFRTGKIQRQPAPHVGVHVGLAMLDLGGVDQLAVDPVAADGFHVVRIGLDAQGRRRIAAALRGRGDLAGLDEPQPDRAVGRR